MAVEGFSGGEYRMQPRIRMRREVVQKAPGLFARAMKLVARADDDDCKNTAESNTCEKPVGSMSLVIGLAVAIPVVVALGVLFYLHRRNVKKQRLEDATDPHRDLDFGLNDGSVPKMGKRKSILQTFGGGEKAHKTNQLSMDMNLSSPYLLPPGIQGSHDSVNTLGRTFTNEHDPYRHVTQYVNSETGSVRSFGGKSQHNKRASVVTGRSTGTIKPTARQGSFPKTSMSSPDEKTDPFLTPTAPTAPESLYQSPSPPPELQAPIVPRKPIGPTIGSLPHPKQKIATETKMPEIQQPPTAVARESEFRTATPPQSASPPRSTNNIGLAYPLDDHYGGPEGAAGLGLNLSMPDARGSEPAAVHQSQDGYDYNPQIQTSEHYDEYEEHFDRGRPQQRQQSLEYGNQQQQGLGVPQQNDKRLSIGVRPLPPDEVTESEDPEYRANRIRSFYKEYFDDSKETAPPVPNMPAGYGKNAQYHEDYDERYLGEAAYFDPDSNAFVMPYAQPVHRRAMTPPPAGRFRGGPGPRPGPSRGPRGPGSISSFQGGYGRPRAGSARGSPAPSTIGPRPDSSASGRGRQPPRKQGPPPAPLTTLPTPSKLKDDNFAMMNTMDFAPPDAFGQRARGRSQSPLGERRAYLPKVPSASPLVASYDEMSVLPSPHSLRKSSTFTGLDFAPPKKFQDSDNMSDAGSIRSNRSGISSAATNAIRSGAGRVSRLPDDTVFTQASFNEQLKPQWNLNR